MRKLLKTSFYIGKNIKYDDFYKYLQKIYNSNFRHIFKIFLKTNNNYKNNNDHLCYINDIIKI